MKILKEDEFPNQRNKYRCPKCGEMFRLSSTMDRHKCNEMSSFNNAPITI